MISDVILREPSTFSLICPSIVQYFLLTHYFSFFIFENSIVSLYSHYFSFFIFDNLFILFYFIFFALSFIFENSIVSLYSHYVSFSIIQHFLFTFPFYYVITYWSLIKYFLCIYSISQDIKTSCSVFFVLWANTSLQILVYIISLLCIEKRRWRRKKRINNRRRKLMEEENKGQSEQDLCKK